MTSRVLVTGASGFVGRTLVPALRAARYEVVTTARGSVKVDEQGYDLSVDSRRLLERVRPSVVGHLAGATAGTPTELERANVTATTEVMSSLASLEPKPYVILLGSAAEYGDGDGSLISENFEPRPISPYGLSKLAQTTAATEIAARSDLRLTIVRPFNLASGDLPEKTALGRITRLLLQARTRRPDLSCGRLDVIRDYVEVDVLVSAIQHLIALRPNVSILNVCSGVGLVLGDIVAAMAKELEVIPRIVEDSALAALPAPTSVVGDPALLRSLIEFSPLDTPESVARAVLRP